MQTKLRRIGIGVALVLTICIAGTAVARELGTREAREAIALLLGINRDDVRIKSLAAGFGSDDRIVTAQVEVSFQIHKQDDGSWSVAAVRLGDKQWEEIDTLRRALDAEKAQRARADLRVLASGVEAFHRERGFYPPAKDLRGLVDHISPRYLPEIIREDPWHQPYFFKPSDRGYVLGSGGPDQKPDTSDDLVVAEGEPR